MSENNISGSTKKIYMKWTFVVIIKSLTTYSTTQNYMIMLPILWSQARTVVSCSVWLQLFLFVHILPPHPLLSISLSLLPLTLMQAFTLSVTTMFWAESGVRVMHIGWFSWWGRLPCSPIIVGINWPSGWNICKRWFSVSAIMIKPRINNNHRDDLIGLQELKLHDLAEQYCVTLDNDTSYYKWVEFVWNYEMYLRARTSGHMNSGYVIDE